MRKAGKKRGRIGPKKRWEYIFVRADSLYLKGKVGRNGEDIADKEEGMGNGHIM